MEPVSALVAFAERLALGPAEPRAAWDGCEVPQRMVIALEVLADPRWMARAACIAWRASGSARVLPPELEQVLCAIETWADGGGLDASLPAHVDALHQAAPPRSIERAATFAFAALLELHEEPADPARDHGPVAAVDMAVDVGSGLDPHADRVFLDGHVATAIRAAIDPFAALAVETRMFERPGEDRGDDIPF